MKDVMRAAINENERDSFRNLKKKRIFSHNKYLPTILFFLWMLVIFLFSMENGELSSDTSGGVIGLIGRVLYPDFESWTPEAQLAFVEGISYPVRKAAHMTEYAILASLGLWMFHAWHKPIRRAAAYAFLCSVAYAATDEFHQLFVPGRSGQVTDVLIDSAGAFLGLMLALGIWRWRKKRNFLIG